MKLLRLWLTAALCLFALCAAVVLFSAGGAAWGLAVPLKEEL